ncbi:MAG TPA: hypothetical protein VD886_24415 [Herpetosiphonaceae bacterium]|nr:hypothetical protein [Herpetosiphonaceae bacterium]
MSLYRTIHLRLRGTAPRIRFSLEMPPVGDQVREFSFELKNVTEEWQQYTVKIADLMPLEGTDPLDPRQIKALSWNSVGPTGGPVEFAVDSVYFSEDE